MRVLIYYPYNYRSVEQQSVAEMLMRKGHKVFFLTTCESGFIHEFLEAKGIKTFSNETKTSGIKAYLTNIKLLRSIIRQNKIEAVISHQQYPTLIAALARNTVQFKLIYIRHNSDEDYQLNPFKAKWFNRIINSLTRVKVAPSTVVKDFWVNKEGIGAKNIRRINYGYDFHQYEKPDSGRAKEIRNEFSAGLLICSMARLVPSKRHREMFSVVRKLLKDGTDCKMICLGTGSLEVSLKETIKEMALEDRVFLLGRKENIFDYIQASDVFLHLSSTEASNSAIKEVGLCSKPVIVCKGVGDFEDYIVNGEEGFLVDKEDPIEEAYEVLKRIAHNEISKEFVGGKLYETVTSVFTIDNIADDYQKLLAEV